MKKYELIYILLFLSIQVRAQQISTMEDYSKHELINKKAPGIQAKTLNDLDFKLSDYKGKTVILHFWSLSCAACFKELPDLNQIVEKYKDKDVIIISLMDNTKDKLLERIMIKSNTSYTLKKKVFGNDEINFQIVPNANAMIKTYTSKPGFPQTFFINKEGIVKDYIIGYFDSHDGMPGMVKNIDVYTDKIEKILSGKR